MIIIGSYVVIGSPAMEAVNIRSDEIERQKIIVTTKIGDDKTIAISIAAAQNNISLPRSDLLAIRFHPHSEVNVDNGVRVKPCSGLMSLPQLANLALCVKREVGKRLIPHKVPNRWLSSFKNKTRAKFKLLAYYGDVQVSSDDVSKTTARDHHAPFFPAVWSSQQSSPAQCYE